MIITLDGPAGCGKSTISRLLAKKLGFHFLDTGATYRAVTYRILQSGVSLSDSEAIQHLLDNIEIFFSGERIYVDGEDRSDEIRSSEVDHNVSEVSAIPDVRNKMVELQQRIGKSGNYIAEGRDMGSVVFPDAQFKFYLDASPEERARRRFEQNKERGNIDQSYEEVLREINRRDAFDSNRKTAPLVIPENAAVIDTTELSEQEVLDRIYRSVRVGLD